jgi:hypothetical protein
MKNHPRSLLSLFVLLVVSVCALGSLDYSYVDPETTYEGSGIYRTAYRWGDEPAPTYQTVEGPRNAIGQLHGDGVEIRVGDALMIGRFENGLRDGELRYYDDLGDFTGRSEVYHRGVLISSSGPEPSEVSPGAPEAVCASYTVIERDYPWFLFHLATSGVDLTTFDGFLCELEESIALAEPRNREAFIAAFGEAVEDYSDPDAEAYLLYRIFSSIEVQTHIKGFPLRTAVVDLYRDGGSSLYEILAGDYPGFLRELKLYGASDTGLKGFFDAFEAGLEENGGIDPDSPLFLDQIDAAMKELPAVLDLDSFFKLTIPLSLLIAEKSAEADPVFLALYETVPFAGPLVRVGASLSGPGTTVLSDPFINKNLSLTSRRARPVRAFAEVSNQGNVGEAIRILGSGGSREFGVRYTAPGGNVTASIILGRYRTPLLDENSPPVPVTVEVSPNGRLLTSRGKDRLIFLQRDISLNVRALASGDPAIFDDSSIKVKTRREVRRITPKPAPALPRPRGTQR